MCMYVCVYVCVCVCVCVYLRASTHHGLSLFFQILQLDNTNRAQFGMDKGGNFVSGYLKPSDVLYLDGGFEELITGTTSSS